MSSDNPSLRLRLPISGSDEMADPHIQLPVLDETNYRRWSSTVRTYLRARKLWSVVSGESKLAHSVDREDWWVKNAAASSILIASVDDTQLEHIADFELASEQWEVLLKIHELPHKPPALAILQYFFTFNAGNMTVDEAATELSRVQAEIRRYHPKDTPSDLTKAIILMNAVDQSYDDVNAQMLVEDLTFEMCVGRLRVEERSRKRKPPGTAKEVGVSRGTDPAERAPPTQEPSVEPSERNPASQNKMNAVAGTFHPRGETMDPPAEKTESLDETAEEDTETKESSESKGTGLRQALYPGREKSTPLERKPMSLDQLFQSNFKKNGAGRAQSVTSTNERSQSSNRTTTHNSNHNDGNHNSSSNSYSLSNIKYRKGRDPCTFCGKRSHDPEDCWFKDKGDKRQSSPSGRGKGVVGRGRNGTTTSRGGFHQTGAERGSDGSIDSVSWRQSWQQQQQRNRKEDASDDDDETASGPVPKPSEAELISW